MPDQLYSRGSIRGGADSSRQPSAADPLGVLLGASIATVFFCFLPEWLHAAIASPEAVWRVSLAAPRNGTICQRS